MRKRLVGWTLVAVFGTGIPGAALADTVGAHDPSGDNFTPGYDITHARYTNSRPRIRSTVTLRDLRRKTAGDFWISSRSGMNTYAVRVQRRDGRVHSQLWHYAIEGPGTKIDCNVDTNWSTAKDTIRVSVPARCVPMRKRVLRMESHVWHRGFNLVSDTTAPRLIRRG